MEAELESEEPTEMGGNTSASKDEGDRGVVVTSVEHRETEMGGDVLESRKRATSEDTALEREAKRAWSPRPSEASSASCPSAPSVVEHAG